MRILLLGSSGRIGAEIVSASSLFGVDIINPSSKQLNITDPSIISKLNNFMPDLVVNSSAFTDVEGAETNADLANRVNKKGPRLLAEACQDLNIPLIHISTDYVFSGTKNLPYVESDIPGPINIYGKSKLDGEQAVLSSCEKHIILRTSWIFGPDKNNFVKTILKLVSENSIVNVVEDEISCPTTSSSMANTILQIAKLIHSGADNWGLYHFCGSPEISRYHYAIEILNIARKFCSKKYGEINPVNSAQFPAKATRPSYSAMNTDKLFRVFNIKPNCWRTDLEKIIQILLKNGCA